MTPQESGSEVSTVNTEPTIKVVPEPVQLSERDCEAIFFVLSTETISNGGQPLYLTPTGREQWNQQGDWVSMPALFIAMAGSIGSGIQSCRRCQIRSRLCSRKRVGCQRDDGLDRS